MIKRTLFLFSCCLLLAGCNQKEVEQGGIDMPLIQESEQPSEKLGEGELICFAESEEEAKEIAEQYGIKLKSFEYGVAVFQTEENVNDVIQRGKDNGFKELSKNHVNQAY